MDIICSAMQYSAVPPEKQVQAPLPPALFVSLADPNGNVGTMLRACAPRLIFPLHVDHVRILRHAAADTFKYRTTLVLEGPQVTDEFVDELLDGLPQLMRFAVSRTSVTDAVAEQLVKKVPHLRWWHFGASFKQHEFLMQNSIDDGSYEAHPVPLIPQLESERRVARCDAGRIEELFGLSKTSQQHADPISQARWAGGMHGIESDTTDSIQTLGYCTMLDHKNAQALEVACAWMRVMLQSSEPRQRFVVNPFASVGIMDPRCHVLQRLLSVARRFDAVHDLRRWALVCETICGFLVACTLLSVLLTQQEIDASDDPQAAMTAESDRERERRLDRVSEQIYTELVLPKLGSVDVLHAVTVARLVSALMEVHNGRVCFFQNARYGAALVDVLDTATSLRHPHASLIAAASILPRFRVLPHNMHTSLPSEQLLFNGTNCFRDLLRNAKGALIRLTSANNNSSSNDQDLACVSLTVGHFGYKFDFAHLVIDALGGFRDHHSANVESVPAADDEDSEDGDGGGSSSLPPSNESPIDGASLIALVDLVNTPVERWDGHAAELLQLYYEHGDKLSARDVEDKTHFLLRDPRVAAMGLITVFFQKWFKTTGATLFSNIRTKKEEQRRAEKESNSANNKNNNNNNNNNDHGNSDDDDDDAVEYQPPPLSTEELAEMKFEACQGMAERIKTLLQTKMPTLLDVICEFQVRLLVLWRVSFYHHVEQTKADHHSRTFARAKRPPALPMSVLKVLSGTMALIKKVVTMEMASHTLLSDEEKKRTPSVLLIQYCEALNKAVAPYQQQQQQQQESTTARPPPTATPAKPAAPIPLIDDLLTMFGRHGDWDAEVWSWVASSFIAVRTFGPASADYCGEDWQTTLLVAQTRKRIAAAAQASAQQQGGADQQQPKASVFSASGSGGGFAFGASGKGSSSSAFSFKANPWGAGESGGKPAAAAAAAPATTPSAAPPVFKRPADAAVHELKKFDRRYDGSKVGFTFRVQFPASNSTADYAFGLEQHLEELCCSSVAQRIQRLTEQQQELQQLQHINEQRLTALQQQRTDIDAKFIRALQRAETLRLSGVACSQDEQHQHKKEQHIALLRQRLDHAAVTLEEQQQQQERCARIDELAAAIACFDTAEANDHDEKLQSISNGINLPARHLQECVDRQQKQAELNLKIVALHQHLHDELLDMMRLVEQQKEA